MGASRSRTERVVRRDSGIRADSSRRPVEAFQHRVEGNLWRPVDNTYVGLDGWAEVHSSWVIFDKGTDLSEGGHASGSFQILFDGAESSSAFLVHGTFDTDKIKQDPWGYDDLQAELRDESGQLFCDGLQPE